jgi:hypothetical protein
MESYPVLFSSRQTEFNSSQLEKRSEKDATIRLDISKKPRPVSRVPRTISEQFLWKTYSKSSSAFRSAHASEPYLTTVITVAFNILVLVCRLIFLFFQRGLPPGQ